MNQQVEKLVSIVWKNNGAIGAVAFFTEAMEALDYDENDVLTVLRVATQNSRLDINSAWQIVIPK